MATKYYGEFLTEEFVRNEKALEFATLKEAIKQTREIARQHCENTSVYFNVRLSDTHVPVFASRITRYGNKFKYENVKPMVIYLEMLKHHAECHHAEYDRTKIQGLDPRQCEYVRFHNENYGSQNLLINGRCYSDRCTDFMPVEVHIKPVLDKYPNRETYLWNNMRGWCVVFRTLENEDMFRWNMMTKIQ